MAPGQRACDYQLNNTSCMIFLNTSWHDTPEVLGLSPIRDQTF